MYLFIYHGKPAENPRSAKMAVANLLEVERRQTVPANGLLLGVAALLQVLVPGQEEAHPGAGGGGGVLAGQEEADQHPGNLIVVERSAVPGGGRGR